MSVEALPQSPAVGQITAAVPALGPAQTELEQRSSRQQAEMPSALAILAPSQPTAPDAAQTSSIEQPKKPPSVKVAARTTFNAGKQTSASAYLRDARLYLRQGAAGGSLRRRRCWIRVCDWYPGSRSLSACARGCIASGERPIRRSPCCSKACAMSLTTVICSSCSPSCTRKESGSTRQRWVIASS